MSTAATIMTAEELIRLPRGQWRYELVEGELRRMSPAGHPHGRIAMRIGWRLAKYVEEHDLGAVFAAETGFLLGSNPDTVRAPDAAFVSKERVQSIGTREGYWPGPPDLAVEVVSPSDSYADVEEKVQDWLRSGVRLLFVVNPRKGSVAVYKGQQGVRFLKAGARLAGDDVVPGWEMPVADLFAE